MILWLNLEAILWLGSATIEGTVRDQATGEPLSKDRVALAGASYQTVMAEDGDSRLDAIPPGD